MFEDLVDALGQLNPLVQRHRGARDVGKLLGLGAGVALQPWNELKHFLSAHPRAAARGDGSTCCDEANAWKVAVGPGIDAANGPENEATNNQRKKVWFRALTIPYSPPYPPDAGARDPASRSDASPLRP